MFIPLPVNPEQQRDAQPSSLPRDSRHFAGIGGVAGAERLAERFYYYMDTLPVARRVRDMHPADLSRPREVLARYLTEWSGGPPVYSAERGHPRLRQRHAVFAIDASDRDAWMTCMDRALCDVVDDEGIRTELHAAFLEVAQLIAQRA